MLQFLALWPDLVQQLLIKPLVPVLNIIYVFVEIVVDSAFYAFIWFYLGGFVWLFFLQFLFCFSFK